LSHALAGKVGPPPSIRNLTTTGQGRSGLGTARGAERRGEAREPEQQLQQRWGDGVQVEVGRSFCGERPAIIESLRASGVRDLRGLATALNNRGVRIARGGKWHVSKVKNLVDRLPA
jgi:hypothetical protein